MAQEPEKNDQKDENWSASVEYLRGLGQIVRDEGLSSLEIEGDDFKITLKSATSQIVAVPPTVVSVSPNNLVPTPTVAPSGKGAASSENLVPIVTPMVGIFYRAPSPSEPNFVEVGDRVEAGQTIGLVEAMKVFNEITADSGGVVAKISVESGQLVETGAPVLMLRR